MKKLLYILFPFVLHSQNVQNDQSDYSKFHFKVFGGASTSSYWANGFNMSSAPVGYRVGLGISNEVFNDKPKYEVGFNVFYQQSKFDGITTQYWDTYYYSTVNLLTSLVYKQIYFTGELNKTFGKFSIGVNAGINYLIKSTNVQIITSSTDDPIKKVNILNHYLIYDFSKDSYLNGITPVAGFQFTYKPIKLLGITYQNNFDILPSPWNQYQYYKKINPFLNCLTLTLYLK